MALFDFDPNRMQLDRIERGVLAILHSQNFIIHMELKMSKELDDLTAEVAQDTTIEASAVTLIQGLVAQITAAGTDPAKLAALTASLTTSSTALAAAVAANTPAAPAA